MHNQTESSVSLIKVEFILFIMSCLLAIAGCSSGKPNGVTDKSEPAKTSPAPLRLPIFRNSVSKLNSSSAPESRRNGRKIRRKPSRPSTRTRLPQFSKPKVRSRR